MRLFCPVCGRAAPYNPEVVGMFPTVCSHCLFSLNLNYASMRGRATRPETLHAMRPYGLTLVRNCYKKRKNLPGKNFPSGVVAGRGSWLTKPFYPPNTLFYRPGACSVTG